MRKETIISVPLNGEIHLIPGRTVHLETPPHPLPPCIFCKCPTLWVALEITQHGFELDKHTLVCGCDDCIKASVFIYYLKP